MTARNGGARVRRSGRSAAGRGSTSKAEPALRQAAALAARRAARCVVPAREVTRALTRMAKQLAPLLAGKSPVVLAIMHGGVFTALELARRLHFPHELDYVHATRYRERLRGGAVHWRVRPSRALKGRTVLVVDDILDEGHTLRALHAELRRIGVRTVVTAVLVVKRRRTGGARLPPRVEAVGVEVEDAYVFGCGMDYRGYWRELRAIYALPSRWNE